MTAPERAKRWRQAHPERAKEVWRRYAKNHPERRRELALAWQAKNRDKVLASKKKSDKARRERSPEKERERQRERASTERGKELLRAKSKRWSAAHPEYVNHRSAIARAITTRQTPAWADLDSIRTVYAKAAKLKMTVDHIVPLNGKLVCGLHVWHNLQLLDGALNAAKRNKHWPDMPERI